LDLESLQVGMPPLQLLTKTCSYRWLIVAVCPNAMDWHNWCVVNRYSILNVYAAIFDDLADNLIDCHTN